MGDKQIGQLVAALRADLGMSRVDLVRALEALGIKWHPTTAVRVEGGSRALRASELFAVADILGVDVSVFRTTEVLQSLRATRLSLATRRRQEAATQYHEAERALRAVEDELAALDQAGVRS